MNLNRLAVEVPALPQVKTGRNATRSLQDRITREREAPVRQELDEEAFWPVAGRAERRRADRAQQRQAKRGRKRYVQRELARERAAADLANLFNIIDGKVPGDTARAGAAINARIEYLVNESDRGPVEVEMDLRAIAKTANLPTPKVKTIPAGYQQMGYVDETTILTPELTREVIVGRTGRAG